MSSPVSADAPQTTHALQLCDDLGSLTHHAAMFLEEAWLRGDRMLLVSKDRHRDAILTRLAARGCPVRYLTEARRLVTIDAADLLETFVIGGRPDRDRFRQHVGALVERLATPSGFGVSIYTEMADLLAEHAEWPAVIELEQLWNDLGVAWPFALLCGSSSTHFGDDRLAGTLRSVCEAHTTVTAGPNEVLGDWLLSRHRGDGK